MKMTDANRQLLLWRHKAKEAHGYTDRDLAKKLGCSVSTLTHKQTLYMMPFYQAMKLKELADEDN